MQLSGVSSNNPFDNIVLIHNDTLASLGASSCSQSS